MRPGIKSGHAMYVAETAKAVGLQMGMDTQELKDLVYAGLLMQIGKMSLPDQLLTLPHLSMSSQQRKRFLNHALEGKNLLTGIDALHNAADLISHQYEYFDGSGDPEGLKNQEIPLGSRILAVIRDYITYLDGSVTGAAMTPEQVKTRLLSKKSKHYDPAVVDTFLNCLKTAEQTSDERPIVEISWTQLQPGMEAAEIISNEVLYLKDQILTEKNVEDILNLRKHGKNLILRMRLGNQGNLLENAG